MPGRLEIICGPMFAGKSTELIRRLRDAARTGITVHAFKPISDTRSGESSIRTHTGVVIEAGPLASARTLLELVPSMDAGHAVVGIDEAHFFGEALADPVRGLVALGARVVLAGVDLDHRGELFEPFASLLSEANDVARLTAVCASCGAPAQHTQRMIDSDAPIVVGGAESYEPRCRSCFKPGR